MAKPFVTVDKHGFYGPEIGMDLGVAGYRLTFDRTIAHQPDYLRDVIGAGLETYLTADTNSYPGIDLVALRENPWDEQSWYGPVVEALDDYANRYQGLITYLNVGNEWNDTGYEGSRMHPHVANQIAWLWRERFPDHPRIVAASDISGNPDAIAELDLGPVNFIDVHLWAKAPDNWPDEITGRLNATLDRYRERWPDIGICMSEIGYSSTEDVPEGIDGEARQADYCAFAMTEMVQRSDLEMVGWYAVQDWRGMGLLREDGFKKLSYWYFRLGSQFWSAP